MEYLNHTMSSLDIGENHSSPPPSGSSSASSGSSSQSIQFRRSNSDNSAVLESATPSKYKNEFIVIGKREKGGFGCVDQVMNIIDKKIYAIKRIPLRSSDVKDEKNQCLIQEARFLASVVHDSVVRYHTSWMEKWNEEDIINDEFSSQDKTDDDADSSSTRVDKAQKSGLGQSYLFIQMELCPKTLRVVIDSKGDDANPRVLDYPKNVAAYFFQILQGLKFLHDKHNLCHRDLNPNNILLDVEGRIKIGDFGLARLIEKCPSFEENLLSSVGTELYRAPEIQSKTYDHRVDLYSCGVILFEMSYHMKTGTERIKVLTTIRKDIVFPDWFLENAEEWQINIAEDLLNHNPDERPTLDSIICQLSDSYPLQCSNIQEEMTRALANPGSNSYKQVCQEFFLQGKKRSENMSFETPKPNLREGTSSRSLIQYIESVFSKHGACHLRTPLLTPCDLDNKKPETVVKLVTSDGIAVNLPHNARVDFARYIVWHEIPLLTRYDTLQTYKKEYCSSFHPRPEYECVFDLVHTLAAHSDVKEADAQVLSVLIVLFKGIIQKEDSTNFIAINHRDVVKIILLSVGVKEQYISVALEYVGMNGFEGLKYLDCRQIRGKDLDLDKLDRIIGWSGKLDDIKQLIDEIIPKYKGLTERTIKYLHDVWIYNRDVISNPMDNVSISLKWCCNVHYYSGVLFTAVRLQEKKKDIIIADGGRYDDILRSYRAQFAEKKPGVVMTEQNGCGISVYITKVLELQASDFWPPQLVVLTCTKNRNLEKTLYDFAKCLRLMGLNCRVEHYAETSAIESYKQDENVLCLVELLPSGELNFTHKFTSLQTVENGQRQISFGVFYNANPPTLKLPRYRVLQMFKSDMTMIKMNSLLVSAQMIV